jgi:hypothetical protein
MSANDHEEKQRNEIPANMVSEFASYCSPSRIPALVRGMQALSEAGLPFEDIADAMYSSPRVFDALKEGDYEAAKELAFAGLRSSIAQLRSCGVPEDRLRVLSESGLAVGEIAFAISTIRGLREELLDSDCEKAKRWAPVLHQFFRKGGRSTHSAQPEHSQADGRKSAASTHESWFDRYSKLIPTRGLNLT